MDCAFVGAGAVARQYAAALDGTNLRLTAVCDPDADRAAALADDRGATAYADLDALLAAESAPLVLVLTPHETHAGVTRRALAADRHVFSQKPLAVDAATARDLVALAADRDLALGCAPVCQAGPSQRRAARALADGRLGTVRLAYAHAHVGRVTEWHDDPDSFLRVGPLYDGAVYPLTLLVAWFGPVARVRTADAATPWPDREKRTPERPSHVEATLALADGPLVRLTASLYAPHRSREFNSLELHGDDGSLYVADCGRTDDGTDVVRFGREGRDYTPMPPDAPSEPNPLVAGPARLAAAVESGERPRDTARRAAHVVAVCNAVEHEARAERGPRKGERRNREQSEAQAERGVLDSPDGADTPGRDRAQAPDHRPLSGGSAAIRLPPVGLGCSRYRDGEYVDRRDSIAAALDAGYRLLDSAELYGNESRIGRILADPGTPDRSTLHLSSKVWNTNHGHVAEACRGTLDELGVDTLDSYLLHWPDAWAYRGPLRDLASLPVEEQEARTFPRDDDGEMVAADVSLDEAWRDMERLVDAGLARTIGVCNVSLDRLRSLVGAARIPPAVVQVECHPYEPRRDLVRYCHDRGIRVVAHTPLSADGLLSDPAVREAAAAVDATPAQAVLAWHVRRGVVPIPSSTRVDHLVENLAAASLRPDPTALVPLDGLAADGSG